MALPVFLSIVSSYVVLDLALRARGLCAGWNGETMGKLDAESNRILSLVRHLGPHQHVCAIHEDKRQQLSAAIAFILGGLERGECLYIADPYRPASFTAALRGKGIDVDAVIKSGRLTISDKRTYLRGDRFVPDEMIRFLAGLYRDATSKYLAFRFAGEMTWVLGGDPGVERLIEYEAKLNDFLVKHKAAVLCQYFRPAFTDDVILNVLRTHPVVIHGSIMAENPYYIPPADFLSGKSTELLVDRYLKRLWDLATAKQELRDLSIRLLQSQDEERRHIARELHDTTGQNLVALTMNLGCLRKLINKPHSREQKILAHSLHLTKQAAREVSVVSYLLHPPMLDEFGLVDSLRWYVRGFSRRSGINVKLTFSPNLGRVPREVELTIFRVVQEALTNVHKHSGSRRAHIQLKLQSQRLRLEVRDFGRGLSSSRKSQPFQTMGIGITGMRERVQHLGGELELHSTKKGVVLRAMLPRERATA